MNRKEKAVDIFNSGRNCAQSVLLSYADDLRTDRQIAEDIGAGFGAGMGRLQKTCGALTGSIMVFGLHNAAHIKDADERSKRNNFLIQSIESDFAREFGSSDCSYIIGMDLNTPEGQEKFKKENLKETLCSRCVAYCVEWIDKNLKN